MKQYRVITEITVYEVSPDQPDKLGEFVESGSVDVKVEASTPPDAMSQGVSRAYDVMRRPIANFAQALRDLVVAHHHV